MCYHLLLYLLSCVLLLDDCLCHYPKSTVRKPSENSHGMCLKNVRSRLPETNSTALHLAARYGNYPRCIKALVRHGSNIEAKDKYGQTPLALAARVHDCRIVTTLTKLGASKRNVDDKLIKTIDRCTQGNMLGFS